MNDENQIFKSLKEEVIKDVKRNGLSPDFEKLCLDVLEHYKKQYQQIQNQFRKVLNKYTFKYLNQQNLINSEDYLNVFFSLEQSCKDTYVCLDEGGDIHDLDFVVGRISEEPPLSFYDKLEYYNYLSGKFDAWEKFHMKILLTILVHIWIELEGFKTGIVMKSSENSTVQQFFFNDCKWNEKSTFFNNINWIEDVKKFQIKKKEINKIYEMVNDR